MPYVRVFYSPEYVDGDHNGCHAVTDDSTLIDVMNYAPQDESDEWAAKLSMTPSDSTLLIVW